VLTSASGAPAEFAAAAGADVLKLDANESTIPPSPLVAARLRAFLDEGAAASYPDSEALTLRKRLGEYTSRPESAILPFNGCDAAIDCAVRALTSAGDRACVGAPTYDRFRRCAEASGVVVDAAYGADPFIADVQPLIDALDARTRLVYLVNPDNPTGRTFSADQVAALLARVGAATLIVDETYIEFAGGSLVPLVDRFDNLLVMRSFSKAFGLAGLRCGYTISGPAIAGRLRRFWSGRDVSAAAQIAAVAALDDLEYMRQYVDEVTAARAWLVDGLRRMGHTVVSSPVNFILLRLADPAGFLERMRQQDILIRDRSQLPQLDGFVRITVGTLSQCARVLDTVRRIDPAPAR
jgi:histidinol-phosphate aminotransferase